MVFNLIIIFVIVLILFFIGSLSYSKAYKVKNKIIEEIERDQGFTTNTNDEIEYWLNAEGVGYHARELTGRDCASTVEGNGGKVGTLVNKERRYDFCIYQFNTCTDNSDSGKCGYYYRVISYMYFDFPIIGEFIRIPVIGETMTFNTVNS